MHYVQFGSNISPDYVMPPILIDNVKTYIVVLAFWIVSTWRFEVESVEMGGGGG